LRRIAYCDSDPSGDEQFLHALEQALEAINQTCLIAFFSDSSLLTSVLARSPGAFELAFLDGSRGDGKSISETVKQLCRSTPGLPIVLLGGVPEGEAGAVRHVLSKPVSRDLLWEILQEALQPLLLLRPPGSSQAIPLNQVLYVEVFSHQLKIHTLSQQVLSVSGALSRFQREAPEGHFLRCHKSYLVNLAYVVGIQRYRILLSGGQCVPTSKKNYNQVRQSVLQYRDGKF